MHGNTIDFHLTKDLKQLNVPQMERIGAAFNKVGLRIIWYPFHLKDRSVHLQIDKKALLYRRIYYCERNSHGYYNTYRQAKYTK